MSRTVLVLVAVGAAVIAAAVGVAWRGKKDDQAAMAATAAANTAPAPVAAAPQPNPAAVPAGAKQAAAAVAAAPPAAQAPAATATAAVAPAPPQAPVAAAAAPAPATAITAPTFDVARIGADGRAVIAGRAAPNARVVLLDGGKEIARGEADARGEWVILLQDPPLPPGQHELRAVHHVEGRAPVTSEQVVVAVVPAPLTAAAARAPSAPDVRRDETMVLLVPPSGAAKLMQSPSPAGVPRSADLQISTMDYDQHGQTMITGLATPGTTVRAYLDDRMVAEGKAGPDGRWKLAPAQPVGEGQHVLRLDRLGADGKPIARLELPFARLPVAAAANDNTRRLHVVRGDNLWNIARAHYGEGWRHTLIFEANKDQIRNPHLIYPGQVFIVPKAN